MAPKLKYAILALPRTCATKLHSLLRKGLLNNLKCDVPYYGEYLNNNGSISSLNEMLMQDQHDVIVKLFPRNFNNETLHTVKWNLFDSIYIVRRENLCDQIISNMISKDTNQWIPIKGRKWEKFTGTVEVSDEYIDVQVNRIIWFNAVASFVKATVDANKVVELTYNYINSLDPPGPMDIYPTGYNYKEICTNYDYVYSEIYRKLNGRI